MRNPPEIWAESFVSEGAVILRELGFEGMLAPIPDEESAVASLMPGKSGRVYGLTKGRRAHFFVYNDFPMEDCVLKLGVIAENTSGGELVCTGGGLLYGAASGDAAEGKGFRTVLFRYDPSGDHVDAEMGLSHGKPEILPCPFEDRKVLKLAIDSRRDVIFGLLTPGNALFSYEVASGKFTTLAEMGEETTSRVLCVTNDGAVYGVGEEGAVWRFAPGQGRIELTGMRIPAGKGKEYVNQASALVYDPEKNLIYGGTSVDGYLFKMDLRTRRVVCLGKPIEQSPIRCLTLGHDGALFGIAGEPGAGVCHLFRFDPPTGDLRDLGVLRATLFKSWVAHEIDAICTNRNGHIVMGENDRMSHLFLYFPPIRPASAEGGATAT